MLLVLCRWGNSKRTTSLGVVEFAMVRLVLVLLLPPLCELPSLPHADSINIMVARGNKDKILFIERIVVE